MATACETRLSPREAEQVSLASKAGNRILDFCVFQNGWPHALNYLEKAVSLELRNGVGKLEHLSVKGASLYRRYCL